MNALEQRKKAFIKLGNYLKALAKEQDVQIDNLIDELKPIEAEKLKFTHQNILEFIENSTHYNSWFTRDFLLEAIQAISESLSNEKINQWIASYEIDINQIENPKTIGVVMAGNLPLVGFHDYLSVIISGQTILAKLSHDDNKLLPLLHHLLSSFEPKLEEKAIFTEDKLTNFDAIIATGSDNTARYFDYYFGKYPNIIRKNRNGVAVLNGKESIEDLKGLADDIFMYFGLGCRNVSKLFVPKTYDFNKLLEAFSEYETLSNHHKYANNYVYNKSIYLINKVKHFDNGFCLIKEDTAFSSPISVLFFEYYNSIEEINSVLEKQKDRIQCLISNETALDHEYFSFGKAQQPELWDYADGIDSLKFILSQ